MTISKPPPTNLGARAPSQAARPTPITRAAAKKPARPSTQTLKKASSQAAPVVKSNRAIQYVKLMRLDKPIGILLLLWPTLWALWLAAKGIPRIDLLIIFTLGVIVMRSAGCVINDYADRNIDSQVHRTQHRPLTTGAVSSKEALALFFVLCLIAFGLVLQTNAFTIKLSVIGLVLAFIYPFMKRYTHLPQVVLGAAFAWSVPMAFAAQSGLLTPEVGLLYLAVVLWTVVYDTFYAMVDRDDDVKIGVKSTAILFGDQDRFITGALQITVLLTLALVGSRLELGLYYYAGLLVAGLLFAYQQFLIRDYRPGECFSAFLNNIWVGAAIFIGIAVDAASRTGFAVIFQG